MPLEQAGEMEEPHQLLCAPRERGLDLFGVPPRRLQFERLYSVRSLVDLFVIRIML